MSRLIIIFLCLLFIILVGFFLIWPEYQKFSTLQQEIKAKETELGYIEEYFFKLNQLSKEIENYQSQLAKLSSSLLSDSSLTTISLINFIQSASSQNGLILKKIESFTIASPKPATPSPGVSQPTTKVKEISFGFETSGSYFALKNFLNTLEKSAKIIEVENVSFSFAEKEEIPTFELKIKTYSY